MNGRTRRGDAAVLFMKIVVNGKDLEVADGLNVEGLLVHPTSSASTPRWR